MLQISVCDDNIDELSNMAQLINLYRASKNLSFEYAVFPNGFELVSALEKGKRFDIYCLDIIMPGFTGIDVAKEIRVFDKTAPILFFTSSSEFALESYSVKAINYVLKPISKEKLFFTFDEIFEQIKAEKDEDAVIVKSNEGIQKILISNLTFVEVIGRNVFYHLRSGKVIECTEPFSSVCDNLLMKYRCFIKPHRSYLVNMQYVDTIENHQVTLQTLSSVPVAQGKAKEGLYRFYVQRKTRSCTVHALCNIGILFYVCPSLLCRNAKTGKYPKRARYAVYAAKAGTNRVCFSTSDAAECRDLSA